MTVKSFIDSLTFLISLLAVQSIALKGVESLIVFLTLLSLFIFQSFINQRNAFLLVFYTLINPTHAVNLDGVLKLLSFLLLLVPLAYKYIPYYKRFSYKGMRSYVYLSIAFSLYWVLTDLFKSGVLHPADTIFGGLYFYGATFLVLPVFYLADTNLKAFVYSCLLAAAAYVSTFYLDFFFSFDWYDLRTVSRFDGGRGPDRTIGIDIRQSFLIFAYALPILISGIYTNKSNRLKLLVVSLSITLIPLIGLMRLVIFYLVLSYIFLYYKLALVRIRLSKAILVVIPIIVLLAFLYANTIQIWYEVLSSSINGLLVSGQDSSSDVRFLVEAPFLWEIFINNFFFGGGYNAVIAKQTEFGFFAIQDLPILGSFAIYGFLGVILYLWRFRPLIAMRIPSYVKLYNVIDFRITIFYTLKVYFLSMITFRLFYVTWELSFPYQQLELAFFVGVYFSVAKQINLRYI